jgi:hypothetical protein
VIVDRGLGYLGQYSDELQAWRPRFNSRHLQILVLLFFFLCFEMFLVLFMFIVLVLCLIILCYCFFSVFEMFIVLTYVIVLCCTV